MNQLEIYFNTNNLIGDELKQARVKAGSQNAEVLEVFTLYHYKSFTPAEIFKHFERLGRNYPVTSIRRAITTLTAQGYLKCTNEMRIGMYGAKNSCWQLCTKKF